MPQAAISNRASHAAKRVAAIFSVLAAALIALLKLLTGLLTGSLGMLSEAAHSAIDLIASGITLFSVHLSDRPADEDHNYGHGKVESLAAFVETGIMFISCAWIVYEALIRILHRNHLALRPSLWPFVVLFLSLAVDYSRSRALGRIARLHRSDALAADSVHFASDLWATLAVLAGLAATYAGVRLGRPWLEYADPIAALVVAAVILRVSWRLAHQTIDALLDATPTTDPAGDLLNSPSRAKDHLRLNLLRDLAAIPGVLSVERLRTRRSGADYFADVTLGLPRNLTFQRSEQLTLTATLVVQRHLPAADVVVHTVPTATLTESVHDRIRAVAARQNLTIHEINVRQVTAEQLTAQQAAAEQAAAGQATAEQLTAGQVSAEQGSTEPRAGHLGTQQAAPEQAAAEQVTAEQAAAGQAAAEQVTPEQAAAGQAAAEQGSTEPRAGHLGAQQVAAERIAADRQDPLLPRLYIEQHLEVDETMPLRQAHELVTDLEAEMRREVPDIASILTHIESEPATIERRALLERDRSLELRLRNVAAAFPEILDIHEVYVTRRGPATIPAPAHLAPVNPTDPSPIQPSPIDPSLIQASPTGPSLIQPNPTGPSLIQPNPIQPNPIQPSLIQTSPIQTSPTQPNPIQANPIQPSPIQPNPIQPSPTDPNPIQTNPIQASPIQPNPIQASPIQPNPIQPNPIQPSLIQPNPIQPSLIQPSPTDPSPIQPNPIQPSPIQPNPIQASPTDPNPIQTGALATGGLEPSAGRNAVHIQVSCHCTLPDDLPMARVHAVITDIEGAFKLDAPEVDRLLIHPEPATDNRR